MRKIAPECKLPTHFINLKIKKIIVENAQNDHCNGEYFESDIKFNDDNTIFTEFW